MHDCVITGLKGCYHTGYWTEGTAVTMVCWVWGSEATGSYKSKKWFYVTHGSRKSFVHSSWVGQQTEVPNCSTHGGVSALQWAAEHVGNTKPSSSEKAALGISQTYWSGLCLGFARGAYLLGHGKRDLRYIDRDAITQYRDYASHGYINPMSVEPGAGTLVFWNATRDIPEGHVAIYVANGYVITTRGESGDSQPIQRVPLSYLDSVLGKPLGWVAWQNA